MTSLFRRPTGRRARTAALFAALVVLSSAIASVGRADNSKAANKAACTDAYGKAQSLRDAQQLLSARDQLRICARPMCTQFIAKDCAMWLADIEGRIPSVALFARDGNGTDVSNVTVSMDGTVIAPQLDGHAIEVDAGRHTFSFVFPDGKKVDQTYVVLEGQKAQRVGAMLAPAPRSIPTSPAAPANASPGDQEVPVSAAQTEPSTWSSWKTLGIVVGVVGLGAAGAGSYFGMTALSAAQAQQRDCSTPGCSSRSSGAADHQTASQDSVLADVAFGVGGVLVATGIVLFVAAPTTSVQGGDATKTSLQWAPSVSPTGGGFSLRGTF